LTIPDTSNHIDETQESCCFENHDSISLYHIELDRHQTFDKLVNFHFSEIELEQERDPDLQFCDSVLNFESMLTPTFLPDLDHTPEPTLIPVPISLEHEPSILKSHITL